MNERKKESQREKERKEGRKEGGEMWSKISILIAPKIPTFYILFIA
jgi:hypothetical protein